MNPQSLHPEPVTHPGVPWLPPGASREAVFTVVHKKPVAEAAGLREHAASPATMRSGVRKPDDVPGRPAFSLVELLVVVSIILVLMAMVGGGVAAARGSQKRQATQALIAKLDRVVQQHYSSYASRAVPGATSAAARGTFLRRLASAELPDNWADVRLIATGTVTAFGSGSLSFLPRTAPQSAYVGVLNSSTVPLTDQFADAECLFMIVMQGGVAGCLDCDGLSSSQKGDIDNDGAFEFLDAWGYPIRYVLWPAGMKLPVSGTGNFFSSTAPFAASMPADSKGLMRPLIFSCGPDGTKLIRATGISPWPSLLVTGSTNPTGNLADGVNCGVPRAPPPPQPGTPIWRQSPDDELPDDNITNFDAEAAK